MNIRTKLQHPLALVVQGFIAGAIILHATMPPETGARRALPTGGVSTIPR